MTTLADFAQYEAQYNPDSTDIISNPYAFTIKGNDAFVVDGGGNTIYQVGLDDGSGIKNVAALPQQPIPTNQLQFPTLPEGTVNPDPENLGLPPGFAVAENGLPVSQQSVPTGVVVAPDGSLTVTEYTYFPYAEGASRVFSVNPNTLQTQVIDTGFTQLTGATYDSEGNLYVLQHINQAEWKAIEQGGNIIGDPSGSIIKIAKDGTKETIISGNGLEAASGLFFGPDGNLYTSNRTRLVAGERGGQLIKIDPRSSTKVPEPTSAIGIFLAAGALGAAVRKRKRQEEVGEELLSKVEII